MKTVYSQPIVAPISLVMTPEYACMEASSRWTYATTTLSACQGAV